MKQHITPEQLMELSPEQQDRLREWWKPQRGDQVAVLDDEIRIGPCICLGFKESNNNLAISEFMVEFKANKSECLPVFSIGQCIELINYLGWKLKIVQKKHLSRAEIYRYEGAGKRKGHVSEPKPELIEALWQVMKEVL